MRFKDYLLLKKGFRDRRVNEQRVLRRAVMTIIAPHLKDAPDMFRVMPLDKDDELRRVLKEYNDERKIHVSEASHKILKAFRDKEQSQKSNEN